MIWKKVNPLRPRIGLRQLNELGEGAGKLMRGSNVFSMIGVAGLHNRDVVPDTGIWLGRITAVDDALYPIRYKFELTGNGIHSDDLLGVVDNPDGSNRWEPINYGVGIAEVDDFCLVLIEPDTQIAHLVVLVETPGVQLAKITSIATDRYQFEIIDSGVNSDDLEGPGKDGSDDWMPINSLSLWSDISYTHCSVNDVCLALITAAGQTYLFVCTEHPDFVNLP